MVTGYNSIPAAQGLALNLFNYILYLTLQNVRYNIYLRGDGKYE